jgi:hypothetical protein
MSVRRDLIEVVCDGPDSGTDCPDSSAWSDYGTTSDLRSRMKSDGWRTAQPGGIDQCSKCRPPAKRTTGSNPGSES